MIKNRLEKNFRKLKPWADKNKIEAYRLYDRDIPEFPFLVDVYGTHVVIYDKSEKIDAEKNHLPLLEKAVQDVLQVSPEKIVVKKRQIQKGTDQYEKLSQRNERIVVRENNVPLYVNLWDYLDTGLFLDHRPIRYKFLKTCNGKNFLNLFCYTGTASLMAAVGGAATCSVDMSKTYIEWAKDNFRLNELELNKHRFIEADVLQFIENSNDHSEMLKSFDVIFLDPPTFSNSKRMKDDFDVERDQLKLIEGVLSFLKPDGVLYFSNNKRNFKLSTDLETRLSVKNISRDTIPMDVHDLKIHHCFEIRFKRQNSPV